jgi:hypothetical protein
MEELSKATRNLNQDWPGQDSEPAPSEYKSEMLPPEPNYSVPFVNY